MSVTFFGPDGNGALSGVRFARSDGKRHEVELLENEGQMLLRIKLDGMDDSVDLLFTNEQAVNFGSAVLMCLHRIDLVDV